jgi:hypothetical protein
LVYRRVNSFLIAFMILDDCGYLQEQRNRDDKKLTKVLSTKLSIDNYNRFVIYSKTAHAQGIIDEPTPSRFLRYIASDLIEGLLDKIDSSSAGVAANQR